MKFKLVIFQSSSWQLKGFEFIKAIHLDPVPFDMERDLLTPTYKKRRAQFLKYYQVCTYTILYYTCLKSNTPFVPK